MTMPTIWAVKAPGDLTFFVVTICWYRYYRLVSPTPQVLSLQETSAQMSANVTAPPPGCLKTICRGHNGCSPNNSTAAH